MAIEDVNLCGFYGFFMQAISNFPPSSVDTIGSVGWLEIHSLASKVNMSYFKEPPHMYEFFVRGDTLDQQFLLTSV